MKSGNRRLIVFVVFDGMRVLNLTGPLDAFAFTNDLNGPREQALYGLGIVSERGGSLQTSSGLSISTESLSALDDDRIFVRDGAIWSSGGVTAGIDLALALIEDDFGGLVALKTARAMVVFVKRQGGQSQFSVPLAAQFSDRGEFAALHAWICEHLADDLRIEQLAAEAGISRRTFMRNYATATGRTPGKTIEAMRIDAARIALEETKKSLKQIARDTGFGDEDRMRRVFQRQLSVNPADYRARFARTGSLERH